MSKRLNFLHYILNEEEGSLIGIFFTAQCENPTKKDWVSSVKEDLKSLEIEMKHNGPFQKNFSPLDFFVLN